MFQKSAFTICDSCLPENVDKKGPYTNQYLCKYGGIRVTSNRAGIRGLCKHDFELLLSSFDST